MLVEPCRNMTSGKWHAARLSGVQTVISVDSVGFEARWNSASKASHSHYALRRVGYYIYCSFCDLFSELPIYENAFAVRSENKFAIPTAPQEWEMTPTESHLALLMGGYCG